MRSISLFVEDYGHEQVVTAIIRRVATEFNLPFAIRSCSVRGGFGDVERELDEYVQSLTKFVDPVPDLVVVATDTNCMGNVERRKRLEKVAEPIRERVVYATPHPHVERWLLLDPAAFKKVLGKPCKTPDKKCDRDRFKQLLIEAIDEAGQVPLLGGIEHASDVVHAMKLPKLGNRHELDELVNQLRSKFRAWKLSS